MVERVVDKTMEDMMDRIIKGMAITRDEYNRYMNTLDDDDMTKYLSPPEGAIIEMDEKALLENALHTLKLEEWQGRDYEKVVMQLDMYISQPEWTTWQDLEKDITCNVFFWADGGRGECVYQAEWKGETLPKEETHKINVFVDPQNDEKIACGFIHSMSHICNGSFQYMVQIGCSFLNSLGLGNINGQMIINTRGFEFGNVASILFCQIITGLLLLLLLSPTTSPHLLTATLNSKNISSKIEHVDIKSNRVNNLVKHINLPIFLLWLWLLLNDGYCL